MLSAVLGLKAWRVHDQSATVMETFTQRSDFAGNVPWISFISIFAAFLSLFLCCFSTARRTTETATMQEMYRTQTKQCKNSA